MRAGLIAIALGFSVAACSGGESAPGPLRYTIDDMFIAPVPLPEQQQVIEAKKDYDVARMEQAKTQADYDDVGTKIEIAHNEAQQAGLTERSAKAEQEAAQKSADMTRVNNADRELRTAQLGRRAADNKTTFLKAKRAWLKKQLRYHQFNIYSKESKWQLEKARVAQAKNIRPAGFSFVNFEHQYRERSEAAQREHAKVDHDRADADAKRKSWQDSEQEFLAAKGIKPGVGGGPGAPATQPGAAEGTSPQTPQPTTTSTDNTQPIR